MSDDSLDPWLSASLAEYSSLRSEAQNALDRQHRILTFGVTALAILTATGQAGAEGGALYPALILSVITPVAALITQVLWLGEVERMIRVGSFLADLEDRVNDYVRKNNRAHAESPLNWERWLRGGSQRIISAYKPVPFVFAGFAAVASGLGIASLEGSGGMQAVALGVGDLIAVITLLLYYGNNADRIAESAGLSRPVAIPVLLVRLLGGVWTRFFRWIPLLLDNVRKWLEAKA